MATTKREKKCGKLNSKQQLLVEENIALAYSRASIYRNRFKSYDLILDKCDFDSYALEGLCEAALRFDSSKNVKFSTFAVSYIDNFIKTNVHLENSTIKVPTYSPDKDKHMLYKNMALKNTLISTVEQYTEEYNGTGFELTVLDLQGRHEVGIESIDESLYMNFVAQKLPEKEREIFNRLFFEDMNLSEIAKELNLHLNTVSRRKKRMINSLKNNV